MPSLASVAGSPILKQYAQGAAQTNVAPVADFLAPVVNVSALTGRYKQYDEKNKFHPPSTERAYGARATTLDFNAADKTYNCTPHALDFPIDVLLEREANEAQLESAMKEGADLVSQAAMLDHEVKVINAAVTALNANSPVSVTWSGGETSDDPIADVDAQILAVIKAARYGSLMGVGLLFGATAWVTFKNNLLVRGKFVGTQGSEGGSSFAQPTPTNVSGLFVGNPEVKQSFMVLDTAPEGVAANIQFILDNSLIVFARMANPTRRDPSFMKTFRLDGQWMVPGSYMRDDGRVEVAKFDWSEDIEVTNTVAGKIININ